VHRVGFNQHPLSYHIYGKYSIAIWSGPLDDSEKSPGRRLFDTGRQRLTIWLDATLNRRPGSGGEPGPGRTEHWLGTLRTPLAAVHSRSMQCGNLFQVGVPNNSKFWVLYAEGLLPSILGRELLRYVRHNLLTSCCKRATILQSDFHGTNPDHR
jgi:hypothetical protein